MKQKASESNKQVWATNYSQRCKSTQWRKYSSQEMAWEQSNICRKKWINTSWFKPHNKQQLTFSRSEINGKCKTINHLKDNIQEMLLNVGLGDMFLDRTPKA
jgi:hypothetical protein